MSSFVWNSPVATAQPGCHGNPTKLDPQNRECRQCTFQNSCSEKVVQIRRASPVQQVAAFWPSPNQPQAAQPIPPVQLAWQQQQQVPVWQQPAPVNWAPQQQNPWYQAQQQQQQAQQQAQAQWQAQWLAQQQQAQQKPQWVQPQMNVQQQAQQQFSQIQQMFMQNPQDEAYGRFQDPLHWHMASNPVPPRPQIAGESFWTRVFKNTILSTLESILKELILSIRQMFLPPPRQQVIDVEFKPA